MPVLDHSYGDRGGYGDRCAWCGHEPAHRVWHPTETAPCLGDAEASILIRMEPSP